MKIDYQQALQRIEKHRGVWLLHGGETLLEQNLLTAFRQYWQQQGIERQRFDLNSVSDWKSIFSALNSLSLFSTDLAIEVYGNIKPDAQVLKLFKQFIQQPTNNTLVLVFPKQDSQSLKSAFFQTIEANGILVNLNIYQRHEQEQILRAEAHKIGVQLTPDAWDWLLYHHENNLLSARNSLIAVSDGLYQPNQPLTIQVEDLQQFLHDQSRYNSFDLGTACLKGDTNQALKILNFLIESGEAPTLIFWALQKEMRLILQIFEQPHQISQLGIWKTHITLYQNAVKRHTPQQLLMWTDLLLRTDRAIKGLAGSPPVALLLKTLVLALCGQPLPHNMHK